MTPKGILAIVLITAATIASYFIIDGGIDTFAVKELSEPVLDFKVMMCAVEDCKAELLRLAGNGNAKCALYSLNDELLELAHSGIVEIVTDDSYKKNSSGVKKDGKQGLMHNKFCVSNSTVLTGSFNSQSPQRDRNNLIIINSTQIAKNYDSEFIELWAGKFGGGEKTKKPILILNHTRIETYFCPEDDCASKLVATLSQANKSIYFMTYSFTHEQIANELILAKERGVEVAGVVDKTSDKAVYEKLSNQGIPVRIWREKGLLHHKVFIIDEHIVTTGSFNPTNNGNKRNDENLFIADNEDFAKPFLKEFYTVYS